MNGVTIFIENHEPTVYDLDSFGTDYVRFGRGPFHGEKNAGKNDIAVPVDILTISRAHCTFYKMGGSWYICDDRSVNGLSLNGVKITAQQMHDGDKFCINDDDGIRCVIAFSSRQSVRTGGAMAQNAGKFPLAGKNKFVLGRSSDCDIVLNHPTVSRHHCVISLEGDAYYISDNNSMNGVILNGGPLMGKQRMMQMDKITIADMSMVFCDNSLYITNHSGGVSVAAHEVVKEVRNRKSRKQKAGKRILNQVSLSIEPGEFVAIIGGSGAGKSTLLGCLSGMAEFTSGDILVNGESIRTNSESIRSIIGYVPQDDIVYDNLTLESMLYYSARLRMPRDTTRKELEQKIDETLKMVELESHRDTVISNLSGGQKKRASIAVELLASPRLFFLDEPSSGLDPGTEKNLMAMLKKLALTGKTVVMVTHTVQNISMCDKVICMGNGGRLCFSGTPKQAPGFFGKKSMTDIYEDLNGHSEEAAERFKRMSGGMADESAGGFTPMRREKKKKPGLSLLEGLHQFRVMTARYAKIMLNNRPRFLLLILMPVALTILVCIAFQADGNLYNYLGLDVRRTSLPFLVGVDTMKLMFTFSCAVFWVGIFNSIQEISRERTIYRREQFTGVKTFPYIASKVVVLGVLCILQSLIMMLMFAFFTNTTATVSGNASSVTALRLAMPDRGIVFPNGGLWFEVYITSFLAIFSSMCLGLVISAAASNEMALVLCPVCLLPQILFSGVASTLSGVTEMISNFITCRWSCIAYFASTGINDMYESCRYDMGVWEKTPFHNGFGIDEAYSAGKTYVFGLDPVRSAWAVLLLMSAICIVLSVLMLYLKSHKNRIHLKITNKRKEKLQ